MEYKRDIGNDKVYRYDYDRREETTPDSSRTKEISYAYLHVAKEKKRMYPRKEKVSPINQIMMKLRARASPLHQRRLAPRIINGTLQMNIRFGSVILNQLRNENNNPTS